MATDQIVASLLQTTLSKRAEAKNSLKFLEQSKIHHHHPVLYSFHYTKIVSPSSNLHKPVCISLEALRIKITCLLLFFDTEYSFHELRKGQFE